MEFGSDTEGGQFQDGSAWVPQTPAKSTPARLKSDDCTTSSTFFANQDHGLIKRGKNPVDEDIKVYTRTKHKGSRKKRYRPKVVQEVKIKRTPKTKTSNPSTPKPRTPKPPKRGTSRKYLGNKSDGMFNNILKASHEASQGESLDSCQVLDQTPVVSPHIFTDAVSSTVSLENCDINYVQKGSRRVSYPNAEESADKNLMDLKPEVESRSCRRALNFSLLSENDRRERFKLGRRDLHDCGSTSYATPQRCGNSPLPLVYERKKFKLGRCDLLSCRKFGPDFPKLFRKGRTERTTSFITFLTSLLALGSQSGNMNNRLNSVIAAKDTSLNIVKKGRTGRKKKVFPALTSVLGTDVLRNCDQPKNSLESSEIQVALIPVAQSLVPPLSTPRLRTINVSEPKLYCGVLIPRSGPPTKKLRVLEEIMKKFQRLHIDDIRKRPGPKKKEKPGVGEKPGEMVSYDSKPKKVVAKVVVDQETKREWNLLMQVFHGGAEKERGRYREKWWEEERRKFSVRALTFVAIMHLIQGDRRFSEWMGSVVDSVVGVFLTQNVSDHLSSAAFMSLASRFPIKPKNKLVCVNSSPTEIIPIIQGVEPERGECSRNNQLLESDSVLQTGSPSVKTTSDSDKNQENPVDWDELRRTYGGGERDTSGRYSDSVDWEAVRLAPAEQVSNAIRMRGQHVVIGAKIQAFLNRLVKDHGSMDLEWLRNVPPEKTKEYLLSFNGLGLKSVECVRLLCLHHHAFPVDINVARVAVRLGWVPLQALPGGIEFHLLDEYPIMDTVQVYLWPRLCKLDQKTLYELHYQMITFGKVFCKKRKPSCGPCPMKGACKHYASGHSSSRLSLPGTEKQSTSSAIVSISAADDSPMVNATTTESFPPSSYKNNDMQPLVEFPPSPVHVSNNYSVRDIEDWYGQSEDEDDNVDLNEDDNVDLNGDDNVDLNEDEDEDEDEDVGMNVDDIPTVILGTDEGNEDEDDMPIVKLGIEELKNRFREAMRQFDITLPEDDVSNALITLTSGSSIPMPKLKNVGRLKTVHHVYELPDDHPILAEVQKREPDDPCPYLLVIWATDADAGHPKQCCSTRLEPDEEEMSCSLGNMKDQNSETVRGTLMIPCRTANRGSFPLNGTYFQVNEVFVDDESAKHPIHVPRKWLWNLRRRFLYCGSSASAIFTAIPIEEIQQCFWRGFICVRAFNRRTRAPVGLPDKFHLSTASKSGKGKNKRKHTEDV